MRKRTVRKKRVAKKKGTRRKRPGHRIAAKRTPSTRKKSTPRKTRRRRKKAPAPKVLKAVERVSVERTLAGKRKKRRRAKRVQTRSRSRRRTVSGKGSGLLVGLAIGVGAYLLLSNMNKQSTTTYPPYYGQGTGQLIPTNNVTRNSQSQDILNYAMAAGLAFNAISSIIDKLNSSSDDDVKNMYDNVVVSGGDPYVYV